MIEVLVNGACGRMGSTVANAVREAEDLHLAACVDIHAASPEGGDTYLGTPYFKGLQTALEAIKPDVVVDFTHPSVVADNIRTALAAGVATVVGTTGLSEETLAELSAAAPEVPLFVAPNFTTGAVLMMQFAKMAAKYFPDAEIIEMHHDGKKDAPSGTALQTARLMGEARGHVRNVGPGPETETPGHAGARGCEEDGIRIHSVRGAGFMASQEVVLSSLGQTLTIRHDSTQRESYMPGVLLAVRSVADLPDGFTVGLERIMGL